jgi:hypothetical protein
MTYSLKGYPSTPYTLRPFAENKMTPYPEEKAQHRAFNKALSSMGIKFEHAFGLVKGQFQSLKELGVPNNLDDMYYAVVAMMVLHNLCLNLGDHPESIKDFDPQDDPSIPGQLQHDEDEDDIGDEGYNGLNVAANHIISDPTETDDILKTCGIRMRMELLEAMFPLLE